MKKLLFCAIFGAVLAHANFLDEDIRLCDEGRASSCDFLINYYKSAEQEKHRKAYEIVAKLCLNGDDSKCEIIRSEEFFGGDRKRYAEILEKSCDEKNIKSCLFLLEDYPMWSDPAPRVQSVYDRLCKFGALQDCDKQNLDFSDVRDLRKAHDIARAARKLETLPKELKKSAQNKLDATKFDDMIGAENFASEENLARVKQKCEEKNSSYCALLGYFYEVRAKASKDSDDDFYKFNAASMKFYKKACEYGEWNDWDTGHYCSGYGGAIFYRRMRAGE